MLKRFQVRDAAEDDGTIEVYDIETDSLWGVYPNVRDAQARCSHLNGLDAEELDNMELDFNRP